MTDMCIALAWFHKGDGPGQRRSDCNKGAMVKYVFKSLSGLKLFVAVFTVITIQILYKYIVELPACS